MTAYQVIHHIDRSYDARKPLTWLTRPVNILVGVSGSVATIKLKLLVTQLGALRANIRIVATDAATRFFDRSWAAWEGKPEVYGTDLSTVYNTISYDIIRHTVEGRTSHTNLYHIKVQMALKNLHLALD